MMCLYQGRIYGTPRVHNGSTKDSFDWWRCKWRSSSIVNEVGESIESFERNSDRVERFDRSKTRRTNRLAFERQGWASDPYSTWIVIDNLLWWKYGRRYSRLWYSIGSKRNRYQWFCSRSPGFPVTSKPGRPVSTGITGTPVLDVANEESSFPVTSKPWRPASTGVTVTPVMDVADENESSSTVTLRPGRPVVPIASPPSVGTDLDGEPNSPSKPSDLTVTILNASNAVRPDPSTSSLSTILDDALESRLSGPATDVGEQRWSFWKCST